MKGRKLRETNIHFLYIVIISGIVIIGLLSALFFPSKDAQKFLSFAGVALSLVLSVIAILITLWDVAGQRQQVADITESAKKLRKTVKEQKENYENIDKVIVKTVKEIMSENLSEQTNQIKNIFDTTLDNSKIEKDDKTEIKSDFDNALNLFTKKNKVDINWDTLIETFELHRELSSEEYGELTNIINSNTYRFKTYKSNNFWYLDLRRKILSVIFDETTDLKEAIKVRKYLKSKDLLKD